MKDGIAAGRNARTDLDTSVGLSEEIARGQSSWREDKSDAILSIIFVACS